MSVMIFLMVGLAIDGGLLYLQRRLMQNTADAACLSASSQLSLGNTTADARTAAETVIGRNLGPSGPGTGVNAPGTLAYTAIGDVYNNASTTGSGTSLTHGIEITGADVRVALHSPATTFFMRIAGIDQYSVSARAHCNANAGGGVSPFAIARWRATPGSLGLTTDLPIAGQEFAGHQMEVYDILRHDTGTNEFITNWPEYGETGYPGDPSSATPCCLYSNPPSGEIATTTNPGPWTSLVGDDASANTGGVNFRGSVLLDLRQITFADVLSYNGITPDSSTNSLKDQVVRWINNAYPGPMVEIGQQLAWISGVNTGTVIKDFWLRHEPGDLVSMLIYNGTVYSKADYKVSNPGGGSGDQVDRSSATFEGADEFPPQCDIAPYTNAYIFNGGSVSPSVGTSPASYDVNVEPIVQPGVPGTPILNYKMRAFLSTDPTSWGNVQGRWSRSGASAWNSGWRDLQVNGSPPVVTVSRLDDTQWPFTFQLQQSATGTCTYVDTSVTPAITTTATLPLRYSGAQTVYLEMESQDGKRRAMYDLINMGAASDDFFAYFPGPIAYKPMIKPTGGGAVKEQPEFIIQTVGGTNLIKGDAGLSSSFNWFKIGDDPTNALTNLSTPPTGLKADLIKRKVGGIWKNFVEVELDNTAEVAKRYYLRVNVSYDPPGPTPPRTHWAWYYIEVPDPLNSSIDSFVYTLGYATFEVSNINPNNGNVDVNTVWGRAVTGLILDSEELKTGMLPRLVPWEQ